MRKLDDPSLHLKPLTSALTASLLIPLVGQGGVNMVSAPVLARDRGIQVETVNREQQGAYENTITLTVVTERQERSVTGTVFAGGKPRLVEVKGINMEAEITPDMLYITNIDKPGFIGRLGTLLGDLNINIANFNLGRGEKGGDAIALLNVDSQIDEGQLAQVARLEGVVQAKSLRF